MSSQQLALGALAVSLLLSYPGVTHANGIVSHIHISNLARELLPAGDLQDLLDDPEVYEPYRAGSIFPDTGYGADDPYGEMAHWEPFTDAYIQYIRETYPPPFDSPEARRHVAYLLGSASHSMADQWFDSLFMARVTQIDGSSDALDSGSDPWLIVEHDPDARIEGWVDAPTMNEIFLTYLDYEPGVETIEYGMDRVVQGINALYFFAEDLYEVNWLMMPWGATHYHMAEGAPGSLPHIAEVVALYWQVIWERLHGTDEPDDSFLMTWPPDGYQNFEVDHELIETRIAVGFGHGVTGDSLTAENIRIVDADGVEVPLRSRFIYGGPGNVVLVRPQEILEYDSEYSVELDEGLALMDGRNLTTPVTFSFHTRCSPDRLEDCPPLPEPWVAPDEAPPIPTDAGPTDAGPGDADVEATDGDLSDGDTEVDEIFVTRGGCAGCVIASSGGTRGPSRIFTLLYIRL